HADVAADARAHAGLLAYLAERRLLHGLAGLELALRQRPAARAPLPFADERQATRAVIDQATGRDPFHIPSIGDRSPSTRKLHVTATSHACARLHACPTIAPSSSIVSCPGSSSMRAFWTRHEIPGSPCSSASSSWASSARTSTSSSWFGSRASTSSSRPRSCPP